MRYQAYLKISGKLRREISLWSRRKNTPTWIISRSSRETFNMFDRIVCERGFSSGIMGQESSRGIECNTRHETLKTTQARALSVNSDSFHFIVTPLVWEKGKPLKAPQVFSKPNFFSSQNRKRTREKERTSIEKENSREHNFNSTMRPMSGPMCTNRSNRFVCHDDNVLRRQILSYDVFRIRTQYHWER